MLRRSDASPFMPGLYVFPGGVVDDDDYAQGPVVGWDDARIAAEPRDAHALVRAGARELHEEAGITVDPASLTLFSHWITPTGIPRRFDTYFFIAQAPEGAIGVADAVETHDARWLTAGRALEAYRDGALPLFFPTIKHLERLAPFGGVEALLAFARDKPIVTIQPEGPPSEPIELPRALEGRW